MAENTVSMINDNMLIYTMDHPNQDGLRLEGMGFSGDSGGPALYKDRDGWKIAGVKSNGECCDYGASNEYTRLGDIAYKWITDNTKFDSNGNPVAEEVPIPADQCQKIWMDPSGDGTDWQELFNVYD